MLNVTKCNVRFEKGRKRSKKSQRLLVLPGGIVPALASFSGIVSTPASFPCKLLTLCFGGSVPAPASFGGIVPAPASFGGIVSAPASFDHQVRWNRARPCKPGGIVPDAGR